jgi:hypothetical protein
MKLIKSFEPLFFSLLIISYFVLGCYLISTNALTSDEPAYIGTAYFYQKGLGYNIEHPLLLKVLNSLVLSFTFPNHPVTLPEIDPLNNLQVNLAPYAMGLRFLKASPPDFEKIIFVSRFTYLLCNSALLFWLFTYTYIIKKIRSRISITLAILFVFSPSFYSHDFLITFDSTASIFALLTILSLAMTIAFLDQWSNKGLIFQFVTIAFFIFFAINVKFSNLILLPIVIITYGLTAFYLYKKGDFKFLSLFGLLSGISLLIQPIFIASLYHYAFGSFPNQSFFANVGRFFQGAFKTRSMVVDIVKEPFWDGNFIPINYGEYISRIFWYKENPALFLLAIFLIVILLKTLFTNIKKENALTKISKVMRSQQMILIVALGFLLSIYPLLYLFLARSSRFVIGYRHFYPVLIFIYTLLAIATVVIKTKLQKLFLTFCLTLYIVFGIAGISQSLSYVNFFWTKDKWQFTNDSTLNWGQEHRKAAEYLITEKLLPLKNDNILISRTFSVFGGVNEYLETLSKKLNYPLEMETYYNTPLFDPFKSLINELQYKYLLIDSEVMQQLVRESKENKIALENLNFLQKNKPIFNSNQILFIYQLY